MPLTSFLQALKWSVIPLPVRQAASLILFGNRVTRRKYMNWQVPKTGHLVVTETEFLQDWNLAVQLRYIRKCIFFSLISLRCYFFFPSLPLFSSDSFCFVYAALWSFRPDKFFQSPGFPLQPSQKAVIFLPGWAKEHVKFPWFSWNMLLLVY